MILKSMSSVRLNNEKNSQLELRIDGNSLFTLKYNSLNSFWPYLCYTIHSYICAFLLLFYGISQKRGERLIKNEYGDFKPLEQ